LNFQADRYQFHKLLDGQNQSESFLAVRKDDNRQVVLKCSQQNCTADDLRAEYQILQQLDHANIHKVLALDLINGKPALVYDYFDGIALDKFLDHKPLPVLTFFPIAIKLAEALSTVHQKDIIHCNLDPSNILINLKNNNLLLIGFCKALTKKQSRSGELIPLSEDKQNYWAPEQSGRMNRLIDHRTDIYSLGIIFYQILGGCCPFNSKDSIGLLHNHIAKTAPLLSELDLENPIPSVLSRIIDKMIAKNPDDRYQSLLSFIADIQICQQALHSSSGMVDFDIGKTNNSEQLFKSEKLYGRESEISQLMDAFNKACEGTAVLVLLKGQSGVGKSSIVNSANRQRMGKSGYCITAKFDQFKHNVPFEMLFFALGVLVKTVLGEKEETVILWRDRILNVLAGNAQLIIDVIPEVEFIIGPQSAVQELPPLEAKIRLNRSVNQFIQVFCRPEQPLCIFLDDLQWADNATLEWLKTVLFNASHLVTTHPL
jgi:serine/threonine protein kinase